MGDNYRGVYRVNPNDPEEHGFEDFLPGERERWAPEVRHDVTLPSGVRVRMVDEAEWHFPLGGAW